MKKIVSIVTTSVLVFMFGTALAFAADVETDSSNISKTDSSELLLAFGSKGRQADQEKSGEGTGGSQGTGESGGTGGTGKEDMGTGGTGTAGGGTGTTSGGTGGTGDQSGSDAGNASGSGSSSGGKM